jgi:D-threo-aldose 1-dehydrogenase
MVARADAIRAICERHGTDIKAAALQFCAAHPVVAAVIPGPRTAAEVQQNAKLMQAEIPGALWLDLRRAGLLPENAPTPER